MMIDLDAVVGIDGAEMRVRDVPYPDSVLFGVGHDPSYKAEKREVQPGDWPHTPQTCLADEFPNEWRQGGTVLVCTGCGLDCT